VCQPYPLEPVQRATPMALLLHAFKSIVIYIEMNTTNKGYLINRPIPEKIRDLILDSSKSLPTP